MKRLVPLAIAAVSLLLSAPAAHAVTWTEIPSGTAATITNIEYQGPNRFWFTTSAGGIFKRQPSGAFTQVHADSSIPLGDIEFQDGGSIGLAVGTGGQVFRSTNSGDTWTSVTGIPVSKKEASSTFVDCTATEPLGKVNAVRFAGNNRVWIFAEGSQVARSAPATASNVGASGTWVDANWLDKAPAGRGAEDGCKLNSSGGLYNVGLSDGFFSPINPDVGWIVQSYFAPVFGFTDNLVAAATKEPGVAGNSTTDDLVLAGDPSDPQRMWSVDAVPYGVSATAWTDDGFATAEPWTIVNSSYRKFPQNGPSDVDFRGGTVLAAGSDGLILMSVNGRSFYYTDDTALPTQDWRSVGVADAANAAVGGVGGKLIISTNANVPVDPVITPGPLNVPASPTPTPTPTPTPQLGVATINGGSSKAPLVGGAAKKQGKSVVFSVKGKLGLPAGISAKAGCSGTVSIGVLKGKKRLTSKTTKVDAKCGYKKTIKVKGTTVGTAKTLTLSVAFKGNSSLSPLSSTYKTKVK